MNNSIFATPVVSARFTKDQLVQAATFLIKHHVDLVLSDTSVKSIGNVRIFSSTPICRIYQNLVTNGDLEKFLFYNLSDFTGDIPSVLTAEDVTVVGSILPGVNTVPALINKSWINITPIAKKDLYHDITITDTTRLSELVVRAALCETYTKATVNWLSYNQMAYVVEFYASVISSQLRNAFNLNPQEKNFIATLFGIYMAQMLGTNDPNTWECPPLMMRCSCFGSANDIGEVIQAIRPYRPNNGKSLLDLVQICNIISECGPLRMKKFNRAQFYTFLCSSFIDSQTMMIAMDYPPYWVLQMLRVASGAKNPVISNYLKQTNQKSKLVGFAENIITTNIILERLG